jgi:hypothetical protein
VRPPDSRDAVADGRAHDPLLMMNPMDDNAPPRDRSHAADTTGATSDVPAAVEEVAARIVVVRGRRVMVDADLATLYGVRPKRLNEQVKRNWARFPDDFLFQLTDEEVEVLRSHFATSRSGHGGRRYRPYVFTEHGAVMLAAVLNSPVAIDASIQVVRAFVQLRAMVAVHAELAQKLDALEHKFDHQFRIVFDAIRQLMTPPSKSERSRIGFRGADPGSPPVDERA